MGESQIHAPGPSGRDESGPRPAHVRQALEGHDLSDLLTVGQAGRLLGISEALLRRRIKSGRLLHETGRREGREVRLIRVVDLMDGFGSSRSDPFGMPAAGPAVAPEQPAVGELQELRTERDQLLERCADLDERVAVLALERRELSPAGGPSRSQWLELESVVANRFVWWRRPATLGWMVSVGALFWLWCGAEEARILAKDQVVGLIEEHREVRGQFLRQLGEWRDDAVDTQEALAHERRAAARDRTLFDERLSDAQGHADDARAVVREDRLRFEGERLRWSGVLEETQQALGQRDAAWRASLAINGDQQAAFRVELAARDAELREERERNARDDLVRRERETEEHAKQGVLIEALEGQLGVAQAHTSRFTGELERMGVLADEQEARITAGLERMEQMQAARDAQAKEAEVRARIRTQLGGLGRWLVLWAPRLHAGALGAARTDDGERPK